MNPLILYVHLISLKNMAIAIVHGTNSLYSRYEQMKRTGGLKKKTNKKTTNTEEVGKCRISFNYLE